MINRVLIGLDGSARAESALPYAEALAHASGAEILLVRAVSDDAGSGPLATENPLSPLPAPDMPLEWRTGAELALPAALREAADYLADIGARLNERGIAGQAVVSAGDAADVLLREAKTLDADLIVLGTHARSVLGRWLHGSVAEAVLARSPVPVLLIRDDANRTGTPLEPALTSILVPLDGSAVAEAALPWATELARLLSAELHLVRIMPPLMIVPGDELQGVDVTAPVLAEDLDEDAARAYLEDIAAPLRAQGLPTRCTVRSGRPAAGIVGEAEERDANLVVMATHGRTGIARALLGSVALKVLHKGHRPLLLVRPAAGRDAGAQHSSPGRRDLAAGQKAG